MEQQLRRPEAERLTPLEAEEVIKRFRDEEEQRQKEMEAQATNPTVADLAEGLGVPAERVARLLAQVRGDAVSPAPFRPTEMVVDPETHRRRSDRTAWLIALAIVGSLLVLFMLASMFMFTSTSTDAPVPPIETTQPPTPDAAAPEGGGAGNGETATQNPPISSTRADATSAIIGSSRGEHAHRARRTFAFRPS
jgi:hypothetical protein